MRRDVVNYFPKIGATGDFVKLNPVENIIIEILAVLMSSSGEKSTRMWNIDFGSNFMSFLFSLGGTATEDAIMTEVHNAVRKNLDDIDAQVLNVDLEYDPSGTMIKILVEVGIIYDDKQYIVLYHLPTGDMLLETPLYKITDVRSLSSS